MIKKAESKREWLASTVKTLVVAALLGIGSVAANWVVEVNTSKSDIADIRDDLRSQGVKLDELINVTNQVSAQVSVNTQSIETIKEITLQNSRDFNQMLMSRLREDSASLQ